jgi:hypothetical protein
MDEEFNVGAILAEMRSICSRAPGPVAVYLVAVALAHSLVDYLSSVAGSEGYYMTSLISTVAGYLLLRALVVDLELVQRDAAAGFGSYFGISLLEGLATLVGAILLVVPAVILQVRWIPSICLLMCESPGVKEAMGQSWERTEAKFWPLLGLWLLGVVPIVSIVAVFAAILGTGAAASFPGIVLSLVSNVAVSAMSAYFVLLGIASYKLLFRAHQDIAEVFA